MTTSVDAVRSNFNADSEFTSMSPIRADILWRNAAGNDVLWLMNNDTPSTVATLPFVTPDWHVKATANFDAVNISSDILWQNDNGALALWQMNGTTVLAMHALPNPGPTWHVVGDNSFDGDQADDILFQNDNGSLAMWTITSAATATISGIFTGTQNPGPTWHVVATGDTNFTGEAGILWQNDNGAMAIWEDCTFAAGTFAFNAVAALPTVGPSWHVKGMADLDHDLRAEVVFQNDNGIVGVWHMGGVTGTILTGTELIDVHPGPSWHIVGLRDMNGDLKADILFQNDNGAAAVWEDYQSLGGGLATFNTVLPITPNPNPNGLVWDLL